MFVQLYYKTIKLINSTNKAKFYKVGPCSHSFFVKLIGNNSFNDGNRFKVYVNAKDVNLIVMIVQF